MNFHNKYDLEEVVADGPIKTFRATETLTKRPAFVHLLEEGQYRVSREAFLHKVRSLQVDSAFYPSPPRLEIDTCNGVTYVVTDVLDPAVTFDGWVEDQWSQAREGAKKRWKADLLRDLVSGNYQGAFEQAGNALAAFPEDEELRNTERVAHLLWQARESRVTAAGESPSEDEILGDMERVEWLRRQIAEIERDVTSAAETETESEVESEREKFALWCYATALRLRTEGNRDGARAVAGQGLACYRGEIDLPSDLESQAEDLIHAETATAGSFYFGPLGELGRSLATAASSALGRLRDLMQAGPSGHPAEGHGRLLPMVTGLAAAAMLITIGWLSWSIATQGAEEDETPAVAQQRVQIETSPSGATILINGEECGTSTCDLELLPGLYQTEARLAGYRVSTDFFRVLNQEATNIRLALRPLPPVVRLFSDIADGRVTLDGQPAGEMLDGVWEHELTGLAPGAHTLTISSLGSEATLRFETRPGSAPVLLGPVRTHNLRAAVVSGLGSSAQIYSDSLMTEAVLSDGTAGDIRGDYIEFNNLPEGSHELTLATGQNRQQVFFDSGPQPTLTAFIQADRSYGALRITTGRDAVNVYINGKKYRRSTRNGELLVYLYPDQYSVWVEKDGYRSPPAEVVAIRQGQRTHVNFSVTPLQTAPLLVGNTTTGSGVVLDGSPASTMDLNGGVTLNVPAGARTAALRGMRPAPSSASWPAASGANPDGRNREEVGRLYIAVDPLDAKAHLTLRREGERVERVLSDQVVTLAEGVYMVRATAPGYHPAVARVRVNGNQSASTTLSLQPRPQPTYQLADWENGTGWTRQGSQLVRRGGDFVLSPVEPQAGTYEFGAFLQKGSRLEWIVNYVDANNYALYQLGKDFLYRIQVTDGRKSAPHKVSHSLNPERLIRVRVEVSEDSVVHRVFQHGEWAVMDTWSHTGARFARGSFGFHVPGRSEIGLLDFSFIPGS